MALTNEDLLAISQLLDTKLDAKLKPIEKNIQSLTQDVSSIKLEIENTIKPNLAILSENYVPVANEYVKATAQIESMQADIDIMKRVITEHREKLKKIS